MRNLIGFLLLVAVSSRCSCGDQGALKEKRGGVVPEKGLRGTSETCPTCVLNDQVFLGGTTGSIPPRQAWECRRCNRSWWEKPGAKQLLDDEDEKPPKKLDVNKEELFPVCVDCRKKWSDEQIRHSYRPQMGCSHCASRRLPEPKDPSGSPRAWLCLDCAETQRVCAICSEKLPSEKETPAAPGVLPCPTCKKPDGVVPVECGGIAGPSKEQKERAVKGAIHLVDGCDAPGDRYCKVCKKYWSGPRKIHEEKK